MRMCFLTAVRAVSLVAFGGLAVALTASQAAAQQGYAPSGLQQAASAPELSNIPLNPGERIVAVDGVPVSSQPGATGGSSPAFGGRVRPASATMARGRAGTARNIVGNLVRTGRPFSHTPGATALDKANHERRKNGMNPLIPDPQLQQLALQKAQIAASRGIKNHVGGSLGGARAEGVGHTNGRFLSCCLDMPATYGGAAMVQGADGWYCCLLVR